MNRMTLKKISVALALVMVFGLAEAPMVSAQSGIPTTDIAAFLQTIKNHAETLQAMQKQYEEAQKQYAKMEETLKALKGAKDFKDVLDAIGKAPKMEDIMKIFDNITKLDIYKLIFEKEKEDCEKIEGKDDKRKARYALCTEQAKQTAFRGVLQALLSKRIQELEEFTKKIDVNNLPGDKDNLREEFQALSGRINTEFSAFNLIEAHLKKKIENAEKAAQKEFTCWQFGNLPKACKDKDKDKDKKEDAGNVIISEGEPI
jgi:hypothetical protein